MDIETLQLLAIYYFDRIRTRCVFLKIYSYMEEEGNFAFYGLYKCKRRVVVKKVILTPNGKLVGVFSL